MLFIPAFRLFFGLTAHEAIATTIPLTIPTALIGAINFHLTGQRVKLKTAAIAGSVGIVFSVIGAHMTGLFEGTILMWGTAILFLVLAAATWKKFKEVPGNQTKKSKAIRSGSVGVVGGFLNGFFGIGGGAIVVPMLMKTRGLSIKMAVPTSLAIIAIYSTSSTIAHLAIGNVVVDLLLPVVLGSVTGVLVVSNSVGRLCEEKRRKAFSVFMVLMAFVILIREIFL